MNWDRWLDEVLDKAVTKLTVSARVPGERQIAPRVPAAAKPSAAPKRKLTVSPGGHKAPPGGGWRRTPSGWARGEGDSYDWQPLNWSVNQ
jgi:hypothetical protein